MDKDYALIFICTIGWTLIAAACPLALEYPKGTTIYIIGIIVSSIATIIGILAVAGTFDGLFDKMLKRYCKKKNGK